MTTSGEHHVDDTNRAQAEAWNGPEGDYWARHADRFDRVVAGYQQRFLQAAAVAATDRVLDVGCGAGRTALDIARAASSGHVTGVDLSAPMVEAARRRAAAEGVPNVTFLVTDAQVHPFEPEAHDLVVSRCGSMFFGDATAAFRNLAAATRPGGRLVLLTWRALVENEWARELLGAVVSGGSATPSGGGRDQQGSPPVGPFSMADPRRVRDVLDGAGWGDVRVKPLDGGSWFGADVEDASSFLGGLLAGPLAALGAAEREAAVARLHDSLAAHAEPEGVRYGSAAWLVTARRRSTPGAGA